MTRLTPTYGQFAKWTAQKVWFVTRERGNADFHVTKVMVDKTRKRNAKGVLKEQYVTMAVKQNGVALQRLKMRRITVLSEEGKVYVFFTNNFTLPGTQIVTIYKNRWMIELLFKQIKQNFPLRYFWRESQCDQNAGVLCTYRAIADGGDQEKSGDYEIIRQYDYRYSPFNELCRTSGFY